MDFDRSLEIPKGTFKLIVLDIDGTLITSDRMLTNRTVKAIQAVKKAGIQVTFATGRQHCSATYLARKIGINAPLISSDGSMIKDIYTGETELFPLSIDKAKDIVEIAGNYKSFRVEVFFEDTKFHAGKSYRKLLLRRYLSPPLRYSLLGTYYYIRDFVFIPVIDKGDIETTIKDIKVPPAKVVVYGQPDKLKDFRHDLERKYGKCISMTTALTNCVDVLNEGVSKAKGIAHLAENLGIKREEIITVGDNFNDIEMLQYAGLGVAMGNAANEVKEKADYVTASNEDDGLACFLEKLISLNADVENRCVAKSKLCESKA